MVADTITTSTRSHFSSPCTSQDEWDHHDYQTSNGSNSMVPMSPPRALIIAKEGIEVVMPASPTSTMDVFLLMDDDQIQHVKPIDDETGFYISDASETVSVTGVSTVGSLLGPYFLEQQDTTATAPAASTIPATVFQTTTTITSLNAGTEIQYYYSDDDDYEREQDEQVEELEKVVVVEPEEPEEEGELLGLRCLPESICAPLGGFLDEESWDAFWGTAARANSTGTAAHSRW